MMDMLEDEIGQLEDRILLRPRQATLNRLFELKRMLLHLWRVIWPERDMLSVLAQPHNLIFGDPNATQYYLRDVSDHLLWVVDMIAMYRDSLSTMIDLYMSSVSNRLNRVVSRLTVLTLIIGVLTVVSGFYGMNFLQTWPPFDNPLGVPFVLTLMALGVGAVLIFTWWMNQE
jgi:magnesium transporter